MVTEWCVCQQASVLHTLCVKQKLLFGWPVYAPLEHMLALVIQPSTTPKFGSKWLVPSLPLVWKSVASQVCEAGDNLSWDIAQAMIFG